jgi:hypothetical protein
MYRQTVRMLANAEGNCVLAIGADASAVMRDWETEIESMLSDGGQLEIMRDWGAKLAGATLRLAAVLHCVKHGPMGCIEPTPRPLPKCALSCSPRRSRAEHDAGQ